MKKKLLFCLILSICIAVIPVIALLNSDKTLNNITFDTDGSIQALSKANSAANVSIYKEIFENADDIINIDVSIHGAKGDGVTDDGAALTKAVDSLAGAADNEKYVLNLGKNKTYYISGNNLKNNCVFNFSNLKNKAIIGENVTILCDNMVKYMNMSNCENFAFKGINFDRKTRAHFVGNVLSTNLDEGYFDVVSDRNIGFNGEWNVPSGAFCLKKLEYTSRSFLVINKISTIDAGQNKYRVYVDLNDALLGTSTQLKSLSEGSDVIVPTPNIGHSGDRMFTITSNTNIEFKDVNVWNVPYFCFGLWSNKDTVIFDNVNIAPPEDEEVIFSSWRDGFHCKTNTARIIWRNCTCKGSGDDIINISANMMYVDEILSGNEVKCVWPETGGSYGSFDTNVDVVIWDVDSGELIAETQITEIKDAESNHYVLADNIENLATGENIRFCIESHAAPNSEIINCDFDGTLRFHGGPLTVKNSDLSLMAMWIDYESDLEGPIPHNITFEDCNFKALFGSNTFRISAKNSNAATAVNPYKLKNINFINCSGLKREYFQNADSNFTVGSPDYINVQPYFQGDYPDDGNGQNNVLVSVNQSSKTGNIKVKLYTDFAAAGIQGSANLDTGAIEFEKSKADISLSGFNKNSITNIDTNQLKFSILGDVSEGSSGLWGTIDFKSKGTIDLNAILDFNNLKIADTNGNPIEATYTTVTPGDTNTDGSINMLDLIILKKICLNEAENYNELNSDIKNDGSINSVDFFSLRKYLFGTVEYLG